MRSRFGEEHRVYFQQQYEALRREAVSCRAGLERGHGLTLFLAQGMAAWMAALRPAPSTSGYWRPGPPESFTPLPGTDPRYGLGSEDDSGRYGAGLHSGGAA